MKKSMNRIFHSKIEPFDEQVKESFQGIAGQIQASDDLKRQIDCRIVKESKMEEHHMKRFSIKKTVIGVAAACLVFGTVCIAGSGMGGILSGRTILPDYTDFKDMGKAEEQFGHSVDAVEEFANGYKCSKIAIGESYRINEAGQKEEKRQDMNIDYRRGDEGLVYLSVQEPFSGDGEESIAGGRTPDKTLKCGDIAVGFYGTTYKFVPVDYELTEEDRENMERDNYEISYGSDEVEINQNYTVGWMKDGLTYILGGFDLSLSSDEMLSMAKEIIESGH